MAPQILADAGFTDVDAQLEQLAVNARCSPQRIFATQSADKFSNVFGKRRPPPSTVSDLPGPEQTKALAVPSDDGVRFGDDQSRPPAAPDRAQPCPQESIGRSQFRAPHRSLKNAQLVPECKVLQLERRSRFEGGRYGRSQRVKSVERRAEKLSKDVQTAMFASSLRFAIGTVLDVRERLVFRMAVFNGLRPGEIFAIRLGKVASNSAVVDLRIYGSHLDTPKGRKGRRTERLVGLSPGTVRDLELWRRSLGDRSEEAFLFPSETGQTPLRPNNHWKRDMRPRLEKVGLEWVNFQVLRRTHASLSRKAKVDDKVSADQRGHGLGVSLGVYAISDLEQKIDAVTKLESDVFADSEMI